MHSNYHNVCLLFKFLVNFFFRIAPASAIMPVRKTSIHLKLEQALENNKQAILRLMENANLTKDKMVIVSGLRNETSRLIRELSLEIKCEKEIILCNETRECKSIFISWAYTMRHLAFF